ncbi:PKD domain-containing protein [Adhaeribacter sp. BT258]|uniref:PKD domain-containing protein n=1 Tax=Adhaeribacter terrigena TaxID=2793070 RepID=A0ABS1BXR3_9BACT|nr:PKD domain-containing protein [Adhaeribacter terrigena]MBK0401897.1 PKD domain-containing protein [Adhaeribacter terrigena]
MQKVLFYLCVVFLLNGCGGKEKDPDPIQGNKAELPVASFDLFDKIVPTGYTIRPQNSSTKAVRYEWKFGDGETSSDLNPSHHYNNPGTYIITLNAYNLNHEVSIVSKTIKVGEVYLTGVKLNKINFMNPVNQPWDTDGTGPDIEFRVAPLLLGGQNPDWIFHEHLRNDFTPAMLPYQYKLRTPLKVFGNNLNYNLASGLYYFGLFEMNGSVTNREMFYTNSSPNYFDTQIGNSVLDLPTPDYDMTLYFEVY